MRAEITRAPDNDLDNNCPLFLCLTRAKKTLGKAKDEKNKARSLIQKHGKPGIPARDAAEKLKRSYLWIWTLVRDKLIDGYHLDGHLWVYLDEVEAIKNAREEARKDARRRSIARADTVKRYNSPRA